MEANIDLGKVYARSEDVVAREIQGEFIIIPVTSGIADMEDELFSLNESGKAIWEKIDGKKSLKEIAKELSAEYEATGSQIEKDVCGITEELLKRRMLVERS
jgi:hypothetical protein